MLTITANRSVCVGSGQCVFADPDSFDQEDDGKVLVLRASPSTPAEVSAAEEAVHVCPSRALALRRE